MIIFLLSLIAFFLLIIIIGIALCVGLINKIREAVEKDDEMATSLNIVED